MRRRRVYEGRVLGLSVYEGMLGGRRVLREVVEHPGAAAVLAPDERGRVILVRQRRFPHGHALEIPAGTLEPGEGPEECAFRELEEETGYRARRMSPLVSFYPSIGYSTEVIHCFVASGARRAADPRPDDDEEISVMKVPMRSLLAMVSDGRIRDSKTICAALAYAAGRQL